MDETTRPQVPEDRDWILVGFDFTTHAERAYLEARDIARGRECALLVIHVIDLHDLGEIARLTEIGEEPLRERILAERQGRLARFVERTNSEPVIPTEPVVVWGRPFEEILRRARDFAVDMIVLGVAGGAPDLERFLFGSTAEKVIRGAPCPVLCVPG